MAVQAGIRLCQALCLVSLALSVMACGDDSSRARLKEFDGDTQGTTYHIKVVDLPATLSAETVRTTIEAELDDITRHLSTYEPDTELSRFNRSRDTGWVSASTGLVQVLSEARRISELSQGAYDVTVGPLVNLWGFGPEDTGERIPSEAEIAAAQTLIGYTHLSIRPSPPAIRKDIPDLTIDVASIAQGYTVDRVAERLDSLGIANYLVEIGGELRGKGLNQLGGHSASNAPRPGNAPSTPSFASPMSGYRPRAIIATISNAMDIAIRIPSTRRRAARYRTGWPRLRWSARTQCAPTRSLQH
jgi:thiamine biosynthesis lipoprotein ApbE